MSAPRSLNELVTCRFSYLTNTCAPVSAESFGAGSIGVRSTWRADGAPRRLDVGERDGHGAPLAARGVAQPFPSHQLVSTGFSLRRPVACEIISRRPIIRESAPRRSDNDNVAREDHHAENPGLLFWPRWCLPASLGPARAQDYPTRPVKIFIAFPVGGLLDTVSRIVGEKLGGLLGQQFIIEARPGAGGTIATRRSRRPTPTATR